MRKTDLHEVAPWLPTIICSNAGDMRLPAEVIAIAEFTLTPEAFLWRRGVRLHFICLGKPKAPDTFVSAQNSIAYEAPTGTRPDVQSASAPQACPSRPLYAQALYWLCAPYVLEHFH